MEWHGWLQNAITHSLCFSHIQVDIQELEKSGVLLVKEHDYEHNEDTENFTYTPQLLNGVKPRFKQ